MCTSFSDSLLFVFFNDPATTEIYTSRHTLSLHDALPIWTTVLLGDNNTGKSTVFEAIELAIGADRLARSQVIDEHDFFGGAYRGDKEHPAPKIVVEVVKIGRAHV